jgi:CheY-like chemotaxis protein
LEKSRIANQLVVVEDGVEALDYLFCRGKYAGRDSEYLPEVVLLDLKLPRIDGLEVLKQIRANPKTMFLPVVILTSSAEERDMISSYKLGCNSYITKPVEFDQFVDAIHQLEMYWMVLNRNPYNCTDRKSINK